MTDATWMEAPVEAEREVGPHAVGGGVVDAAGPAFDDLYRGEWHGLVALGWSLTGRWDLAEELAQDAFATPTGAGRRWRAWTAPGPGCGGRW